MDTIELTPVAPTRADAVAALLAQGAPSAGALDELECERLTSAGCLDAVLAWEHLTRHVHAGLTRALAALSRSIGERDLVESELTAALAWAPATVQHRIAEADALTRIFPDTLRQLSEARISVQQARSLPDLTHGLDDLAAVAEALNTRPRKTLGWKTPAEALNEHLLLIQQNDVATTD